MSITESTRFVVAHDADGGLRISPIGPLSEDAAATLHEAIHGGLRAGAPRIEVDLRSVTTCDDEGRRVLAAGRRVARHLGVELRVTGVGAAALVL
jgi:anti-anti-sigma regulatory factor